MVFVALTWSFISGTSQTLVVRTARADPLTIVPAVHAAVWEMDPELAPEHVRNFLKLVESGWYDHTAFHRIIPGFVIQGGVGSTRADHKPHPADKWVHKLKGEFSRTALHIRGALSMARTSDPDSADTSFFIVLGAATHLDGKYTIFGKVVVGFDTIELIEKAARHGETPDERIELIEAAIKQ